MPTAAAPPEAVHRFAIRDRRDAARFVRRRHADYHHMHNLCTWILDTLESGDQYKRAEYGAAGGAMATANLIRHRREWPLSDADAATATELFSGVPDATSTDPARRQVAAYNLAARQNYEIRMQRTPVPTKFRKVVDQHLAKIYRQPVRREVPAGADLSMIADWWKDVDGMGTTMTEWMRETVGPLFLALGMIDLYCDHPSVTLSSQAISDEAPAGPSYVPPRDMLPVLTDAEAEARTAAAVAETCHIQFILPQNILWYRLDYTNRYYVEVLIREFDVELSSDRLGDAATDRYVERYRHWTREGWTLYAGDGTIVGEGLHPYGRVPIARAFDRRHVRVPHAGDPRFFGVVDKCRARFNEESEMIYAMDLQCFSFLQAPPLSFDESGNVIPIGPGNIVFTQVNETHGTVMGYSYVSPPMAPLEFIMARLDALDREMDAEAGLARPALAQGKGGATQPASGISKAFDQQEGNEILAAEAAALEELEYLAAELAATVLAHAAPTPEQVGQLSIVYPREFNLLRYDEMAIVTESYQLYRDNCGQVPSVDRFVLRWYAEYMIRGVDDKQRDDIHREIDDFVDMKNKKFVDGITAPPAVAQPFPPPAAQLPPPGGQPPGA